MEKLDHLKIEYPFISEMLVKLSPKLRDKKYQHSIQTMIMSYELMERFSPVEQLKSMKEKAVIAGLLHDCAKDLSFQEMLDFANHFCISEDEVGRMVPALLHGAIGAFIAVNEFSVSDIDIINAIRYHTTGRENMSLLEKVIFISDYAEPLRTHNGVGEVRELLKTDLNAAILLAIDTTIEKLLKKKIYLNINTVKARNFLLS